MQEALRYVTELAGMKYKVEPFAVLIVPVTETTTEQFTRIYKVPPDFESMSSGGGDAAAPAAPADPFAAGGGAAATATGLTKRQSALEILRGQGILFPDGATAVFNKVTSQLIVKNTQPNLDLVEAFVDSIINQITKQVYITTKFVEVTQKNTDELGFDWLLGGFGTNSDTVVVGGGTDGNWGGNVSYTGSVADLVTGGAIAPVTRGLRTGSRAIRGDSVDSLFSPTDASADTVAPGVLSIAGIFTDPQFGVVIRALSQRKGVDLMSAPSVTTKGGQQATVEVIREFIYPTEFDPPQIPTNVGATTGAGGGGTAGAIPVTPTTPTAFEMRPVGVRMEVDPVIGENGSIDLNLLPEVTEFDGFINYGSPIYSVQPLTDAFGITIGSTQVELTPNIINQPIFSTRKVKTSVTVWDGQTVALGGLIREDVQDVEDKLPVFGDIPILGRLFRSEVEDHFKRNLMIFVTAVLIDPAGQRIKAQGSGGAEINGEAASPLLPAIGN
jgi:general secretion pathway protein D